MPRLALSSRSLYPPLLLLGLVPIACSSSESGSDPTHANAPGVPRLELQNAGGGGGRPPDFPRTRVHIDEGGAGGVLFLDEDEVFDQHEVHEYPAPQLGNGILGPLSGFVLPAPHENRFRPAQGEHQQSTFSIDVDTASYTQVRQFLQRGSLPPPGRVRIEELLNYFPYDYAPPQGNEPFAVHAEVASCPWQPEHRVVRIGIKGRPLDPAQRPVSNLVFLLDVSGSMNQPHKLPLLKRSLRLLVNELVENDRVAVVVYAGASGLVLPSTSGVDPAKILAALDLLHAGGSTNGAAGIQLAYQTAIDNFVPGGVNRVVLATDGDFNVGISDTSELEQLITAKAKSGVFLSVLGFGVGHGDERLETLADRGNGHYVAIDSLREARKVLIEEMSGTLVTIAKDVKIQVEFNEEQVQSYRLIGYENRVLQNRDFADDTKDAGEIGAGHAVTALYQVVPRERGGEGQLLTLRLRSKLPQRDKSSLQEWKVHDTGGEFAQASQDLRFASAVAAFGMLLRNSPCRGTSGWEQVKEWAAASQGDDRQGYRQEFLSLANAAERLQAQGTEKK